MLTLALTSSTAMVGVALLRGTGSSAQVAAVRHAATDRRHAEELTPMVADVLAESGVAMTDIERFAVDVGPGRFTGMRVGITTARTLAFAGSRPLIGVTSLETLAAAHAGRTVAAVIDARRAEVFQQRFEVDAAGAPQPLDQPTYGTPDELAAQLADGDLVVGDGADRYAEIYGPLDVEHRVGHEPQAEIVGRLSLGRTPGPSAEVRPLYLRDPDVQVNIKTRHNS